MPYMVIYIAYVPGGRIRRFNRVGDYSYGVYIYAFPVQQSIVSLWPRVAPVELLCSAAAVTAVLAILSWHFIERPAMKLQPVKPLDEGRALAV